MELHSLNTDCFLAAAAHVQLLFCRKQDSSIGPMSSDSLLPLFIVALIVAQPLHLHACLDYVRRFHLYGDWAGQTGFQVHLLHC